MKLEETFINYGTIDHRKILKIIEENNLDWDEFVDRQEKLDAHKHTKTIPIIFDKSFNFNNLSIPLTNLYPLFQNEISDIEKIINAKLATDGKIIRAIIVKLLSGKSIRPHIDRGESFSYCKRIHIPIKTNDECFFTVGDDKRNLLLGEVWEINNDKKLHSVDNFGDTDRIHLIVDWVEKSLLDKYDI